MFGSQKYVCNKTNQRDKKTKKRKKKKKEKSNLGSISLMIWKLIVILQFLVHLLSPTFLVAISCVICKCDHRENAFT